MTINVKKSQIITKIAAFCALFFIMGCAKQPDPVSTINTSLQQDVAQLIDYANNNMGNDPDTELLKTGLKDCAARADAMDKQHSAQIATCQAETGRVRAERNTLALILIAVVLIRLFNIRV